MKRLLGLFGIVVAMGCGGGSAGGGGGMGGTSSGTAGTPGAAGTGACVTGNEACACYANDTCNGSLQCFSHLCVSVTGTAGATGAAGAAGAAGTTSGAAGTTSGAAGTTSGAAGTTSGAAGTTSGAAGAAGSPGAAGTPGAAGSTGAAGAPATGDTCNNAPAKTIDNFATCDTNICDVGGKHGSWFGYADNGINLDFAVRVPPTGWNWQACAAVVIGGPRTSGTKAYAGAGVILNSSNPYDASDYTGIRFRLESATKVWVGIEMTDGGRFGAFAPASSSVIRDVSFASMIAQGDSSTTTMNLDLLKQIVWTPEDPSMGFGYLVTEVSFY